MKLDKPNRFSTIAYTFAIITSPTPFICLFIIFMDDEHVNNTPSNNKEGEASLN